MLTNAFNTNVFVWFFLVDSIGVELFFEHVANIPLYLDRAHVSALVVLYEFPITNLDILIPVLPEIDNKLKQRSI